MQLNSKIVCSIERQQHSFYGGITCWIQPESDSYFSGVSRHKIFLISVDADAELMQMLLLLLSNTRS